MVRTIINTGRTLRKAVAVVMAAAIGASGMALLAAEPVDASVVRSFTPRFRTNDYGDIIAVGNTVVTCTLGFFFDTCASARAGAASNNNDYNSQYVDVDSNSSTANSSRATLSLPAGATVLWAGLYWMGSAANTDANRSSVRLDPPGASPYTVISGQVSTGALAVVGGYAYVGFADVTTLVQSSGDYTVGGVTTTNGTNARGGWSLVVVLHDSDQPLRNLTVFDGFAEVASSAGNTPVTTTISGFVTPPSGAVTARVGAVASEGDRGTTGDRLQINAQDVTNPLNPADNFFNSSITRLGSTVTTKQPNYVNQLGFDIDYLAAPAGAIGNSQTSATLTFTSTGDAYEPAVLFTAIDIFEPNATVTKTASDLNGGTLNPGDQLEYTINVTSTGNETAATAQIVDNLPAGTTYEAGSLQVTAGANVGNKTDEIGDDQAELVTGPDRVVFRIGSGATGTTGGSLAPGATTTVKFKVRVNNPSDPGTVITNQAAMTYTSPTPTTPPKAYMTLSDDPAAPGVPNPTATDVNDAPVANAVTRTTPEDTAVTVDLAPSASDADGDALTFSVTQPPAGQGSVSCVAAVCTYTPPLNFSGTASFTYTVTDPGGATGTATVSITVSPVNDPPTAVNDTASTPEDTPVTIPVTANDTDPDTGASLSVSSFTQGSKGSVSCSAGSCTYNPSLNANGSDTFGYVVGDGAGGSSSATVTVTISAVNDAPHAPDRTVTGFEDAPLTVQVLTGTSDVDGDTISLRGFTQPTGSVGTVNCVFATGACTFTPALNFNGTTTFTYTIADRTTGGLTATGTVTITVTAVNDPPVVGPNTIATAEDTASVPLNVLANDSDVDGDTLSLVSNTQPAHGTASCTPAGTCTYTPAPNYSGSDSFTYEVSDGNSGQNTGVVSVTVTAVNDAPAAGDDSTTTSEDTAVAIAVLANDGDVDGDALRIDSYTQPVPGGSVLCVSASGTCTFTPAADFTGTATFTYTIADRPTGGLTATATVTITVTPENDPPVATPDTITTAEDTPSVAVNVLTNDTDADADPLTLSGYTQPASGTVVCTTAGSCTFTPAPNAHGSATFIYTVSDGTASTTGTVTVTASSVNDPPQALDDTATTDEDTAVTVNAAAGDADVDNDPLTFSVAALPANGAATCTPAGSCTYTPAAGFHGTDTFTYTVSDGQGGTDIGMVTVTVSAVNDAPEADDDAATTEEDTAVTLAVLIGDTDADGDPLSVPTYTQPANGFVLCVAATGTCTYTPRTNFNGTDAFTYTVSDGNGGTDTATVTITVTPVNDAPIAGDDGVTTSEDTPVEVDIAANDSDVDGNPLSFAVATPPINGTVSCTPAGVCTYTPNPNASGTDTFTYSVSDGAGGTDTATVTVNVTAVNDAPVADAEVATVAEDGSIAIAVLVGDTDVDGDALTVVSHSPPSHGSVTCTTTTCSYTPAPNYHGPDAFTYTVSDGNGGSSTATVTITVSAVNDAPVADADAAVTDEDTPVIVDVLEGDTDVDGDSLTISAEGAATNGTVDCGTLPGTGPCVFTPDANFSGTGSFSYTVSDGNGGTAIGSVSVSIRSLNDPPVAVDDAATMAEDGTAVSIDVLAGDSDPDGDALTVEDITLPGHGALSCGVIPGVGPCTYTPAANFNGTDTFTYRITDGHGANDIGLVTITVSAVNDAPVVPGRSVTTGEDTSTGPIAVLAGAADVDGDVVSLAAVDTTTQPANGRVTCDVGAGTCTYIPNPNFNGTDSFVITATDGQGATTTSTVTVVVEPVNDPPVAVNDLATTNEDTPVNVAVLANDTDVDNPVLNVVPGTRATANGSVTCSDVTRSCTYTPRTNFNGTDSFSYDAVDAAGAQTSATVTVTITAVNDTPTPEPESGATAEDTPLTVNVATVLANDTDPDGDPLVAVAFTQPPPGTGSVACFDTEPPLPDPPYEPNDLCTFTPAPNFNGETSFTYTVEDPGGLQASAEITVLVTPVNDPPTGVADTITTTEDTPSAPINVLANDTDVDDDDLILTNYTQPANGTLTCTPAGACTYTPSPNHNGTDTFTYVIDDQNGTTTSVPVTITITPINDPPIAVNDSASTLEGIPVTFLVLDDDRDVDSDPLTITGFTQGARGSVLCGTLLLPGSCTYIPVPLTNGIDTFTYTVSDGNGGFAVGTVSVFVGAVNDPPAPGDDAFTVPEDTNPGATLDVLANDSDPEGDPLTISAFTQPEHGTVSCGTGDPAGACVYTPPANFNGTDTFSYTVSDGQGGTESATVTVTVSAVNDAPVVSGRSVTTREDTSTGPIAVLGGAADVDGDVVSLAAVNPTTQPANGTVTCDVGAGTCTYTPNPNFNGTDSFVITATDGQGATTTSTVTVVVEPVNDPPVAVNDLATTNEDTPVNVAVLANDTDIDNPVLNVVPGTRATANGSVTCSDVTRSCTYTPRTNFNGTDSFSYDAVDAAGAQTSATVTVTITAVNDTPTPEPESGATAEDTPLTVNVATVLANDTDPDGDPLVAVAFTQPPPGTGSVACFDTEPPLPDPPYEPNDLCTFTPAPNFNGETSFTYTVEDPGGLQASAEITVLVTPVNDPPTGVADTITTTEDTPSAPINVLANDTDVDDDDLILTNYTQPANGTLTCTPAGACTYTPSPNHNGTDTFTYVIDDQNGTTTSVPVTITITPINDPPNALSYSAETDEDTPLADLPVTDGDTDVEGPISLVAFTQPANGTVECDLAAATCDYLPNDGFHGTDTFTYTIADNDGATVEGTVTITVNSVNDLPAATNDAATVAEDGTIAIDVLGNDADADATDTLTIEAHSDATNGAVSCSASGCTYTPRADFNGGDSFTYTITDGQGGVASAAVTITVTAVNDDPQASDRSVTTPEDESATFDLLTLTGASDIDGDSLDAIAVLTPTAVGTLSCTGTSCTFTPGANASGTVTITVTITDGEGGSTEATISLVVTPVNDSPNGAVTTATTNEDTPVAIDVLAGATDPDVGDTITFVSTTDGAFGTVSCTPAGACTYTPNPNANGTDTFTYTLTDSNGTTTTTTVTVTVDPVNDPPVGALTAATVDEDTPTTIDLLDDASDADGDPISVVAVSDPPHGTLECTLPAGTCVYTPDAGYNGTDSFTYTLVDGQSGETIVTVTVAVSAVNDLPSAVDDIVESDEDDDVVIAVLSNDTDSDGNPLAVVPAAVTQPTNGAVTCTAVACTYTPNANYNGLDSFTYTVTDGAGGTDSATVTVTVVPVNDAPTALDRTVATPEDTPFTIDLLAGATDIDGDLLTAIVADIEPEEGTLTCDLGAGTCEYSPAPDASGAITLTVTISDGEGGTVTTTITITVTPVDDPPTGAVTTAATDEDTAVEVDVLFGVTDPDAGDTVTLAAVSDPAKGTLDCGTPLGSEPCLYTPDLNTNGDDTFTYTLTDTSGATTTVTVTVTVNPINDAPTPGSGSGTTPEDRPLTVDVAYVLANDTDPDGDVLVGSGFVQPDPAHGRVVCRNHPLLPPDPGDVDPPIGGVFEPTDLCTFIPAPNWFGATSFDYTVRDPGGLEATATITVIVTAVNDAPVAVADTLTTNEDTPGTIDMLANDSDVEGSLLSLIEVSAPAHGTLDCGVLPGVGPCTYTPEANYNGPDSFTYVVADAEGEQTVGTVSITVNAVDDAPDVPARDLSTIEDAPAAISLLDGVVDPEGDRFTFSGVSQPANGTVECDANGECTYTPDPEFSGADSFMYMVTGSTGVVSATVTVIVTAVADPPVGLPDALTIAEDEGPTEIDVLFNDSDPDSPTLEIAAVTSPTLGTVDCGALPGAGPCTYTPLTNAHGTDTFSYTVTDGALTTAVTVTVEIAPVPDPPVVVDDTAVTDEDVEVRIAVLANDSDPDGGRPGQVTIVTPPASGSVRVDETSGEILFTPAPDANGTFTFTYRACDDGAACGVATVTVVVTPVHDAPLANDDTAAGEPGEALTIPVLANDQGRDRPLDPTTLRVVGAPTHGTATFDPATGAATYTPTAGYIGTDSFEYEVCEEPGAPAEECAQATVTVEFVAAHGPPLVRDDEATTSVGVAKRVAVLANDVPAPGGDADVLDPSSVRITAGPANGTADVDPVSGDVTYTPATGFDGTDVLTYEVCDQPGTGGGEGQPDPGPPLCGSATLTITVTAPPDPPPPPPPVPPVPGTARFVALAPARVLDTRPQSGPVGYDGSKPSGGAVVGVQVTGRGGVPAHGVVAVVLNVTATESDGPGFVTAWPSGVAQPLASQLNIVPVAGVPSGQQATANLVTVPVGTDGRVLLSPYAGTHLVADVEGYYESAAVSGEGRFQAIDPARILDTRPASGPVGYAGAKPASGESVTLAVAGRGGVPATGAAAVVLNVTVSEADGPGFVSVFPAGTTVPWASNVNVSSAGDTVANQVIVPLGANGSVTLYTYAGAHVVADVAGWFTDSSASAGTAGLFVPVVPERHVDTRVGGTPVPAGSSVTVMITSATIPAVGVAAVVANITATEPVAAGFVTAYPSGTPVPWASSVNVAGPGDTAAAHVMVPAGAGNAFDLYTQSGTHLVADLMGWYLA